MSSPKRRFMMQHPVVVDLGCSCRRSIFSTLFFSSSSSSSSSSLKQRISKSLSSSSSGAPSKQATSAGIAEKQKRTVKRRKRNKRYGVAEESEAVVKESFDPYLDFYESMLVMIMEKEMYDWEDLFELLHRYLSLNSSCHHQIILRAFADIWNHVFSPAAEVDGGSTPMS